MQQMELERKPETREAKIKDKGEREYVLKEDKRPKGRRRKTSEDVKGDLVWWGDKTSRLWTHLVWVDGVSGLFVGQACI